MQTARPTVYAFTASWCHYCQVDKPRVAALQQGGRYNVSFVDTDQSPDLAQSFKIEAIPAYWVHDGKQWRETTLDELER